MATIKAVTEVNNILGDGIGRMELISSMGSDLQIAKAAWVSRNNDRRDMSDDAVRRVLGYMYKHNHGTPFEQNAVTILIEAPLIVFRQWHRHRIGWSYNEESRRYVDEEKSPPQFYTPEYWRVRDPSNKQGSIAITEAYAKESQFHREYTEHALLCYRHALEDGIAPELARLYLPVSLYSRMYATFNLRSAWHFLDERLSSGAQWEIQQYAQALVMILEPLFPISMGIWTRGLTA